MHSTHEPQPIELTVGFSVAITDVPAFVQAAKQRAIEAGMAPAQADRTCTSGNLEECAVLLFDPSYHANAASVPGCTITDSAAIIESIAPCRPVLRLVTTGG